ncbi:MAG TPA: hypothetical protein VHZ53_04445 [Steroidobacteraceae bacterium]|jgi:hypothetical protein|nr:hypothetical protein [Steroidobacteraceae bacterium]
MGLVPLRKLAGRLSAQVSGAALAACLCTAAAGAGMAAAADAPQARVEARSTDFLAIGVTQGDRMTIRVSRLIDNAPVRDAIVTVTLRGAAHVTRAEADGSYTIDTHDLAIPGAAAVDIQVAEGGAQQSLKGTLTVGGAPAKDEGGGRQMWWWVLNFAACIGFLYLLSRRRKSAKNQD